MLIPLIKHFLGCRQQRVVLNSQHSSWVDVKAGVLQGSILGPLLLLIYINVSRTIAPQVNFPSSNTNAKPKPSPNPNRGAIFLGGNCPDTLDTTDLPIGLNSNAKLFADDTSLLSVVHNITDLTNRLNSNLSNGLDNGK